MQAVMIVLVLIVIAGGGWFYLQSDANSAAPGTPAFDDRGVSELDPVMEMKALGGAGDSVDIETGTLPPAPAPAPAAQPPAAPPAAPAAAVKTFNVTGGNLKFNPAEIRVKKGDKVTINFESTGGLHDWVIDEFDAATEQVRPGTKTSVTFTASEAGTFEYYCAVADHREMGMVGKLIVE